MTTPHDSKPGVRLVGKPIPFPGYVHGLKQPCLMFRIALGKGVAQDNLDLMDRIILERFSGPVAETEPKPDNLRIRLLVKWIGLILGKNGHPVLEVPRIHAPSKQFPLVWTVLQPCLDFHACLRAVELCVGLMNRTHQPFSEPQTLARSLGDALGGSAPILRKGRLRGFNTLHFLKAAHELDIPWQRLSENIFQIGVGAASRLLDSSLTDRTPSISTMLARNKVQATKLLRDAGLPVPPHFLVNSADQAVTAAQRLAYPVVVKPADQDGGVGVSAYLHDSSAVRKAFERAARHSKQILIEKHVHGQDYRLQIVNGVVHGVLVRSPGGVIGDGQLTIRQLVERQNHERETATDDRRFLHAITLDDEAETILATTNMDWNSIPAKDHFIRLRGASNVASGGIPLPVPVDEVHPDNIALALRAARVMRLDVAGIDLLIPDIRESWLRSAAAICEINAQPQMFTTLHAPMLHSLMNGTNGRVPVVIVLSPTPGEQLSSMLHERLSRKHPATGLVHASGVIIGSQRVLDSNPGTFIASRALMVDPALEALVIAVSDLQVLSHGWPVDRCDSVLLVGSGPQPVASALEEDLLQLCRSVRALQPRAVFADGSDPICTAIARRAGWLSCRSIGKAGEHEQANRSMVDALIEWLAHTC